MPDPDQVPGSGEDAAAAASAAAAALRRATSSTGRQRSPRRRRLGTAGDPQTLGQAIDDLVGERGWTQESAVAVMFGQWDQVVGASLAEHVAPESFDEGVLVLRADSTAWATQVRLLLADLHRAVDAVVGSGTVRSIRVIGPQAPSWVSGPRRVKGRGPRDTYG